MNSGTLTGQLVRHSASYLVGQVLFFLSRLVFYCAFTRLFTPDGYGTLNLIASALLFFVVAGRLGQNDAIVRLLPEWERQGRAGRFVASVVTPMLVIGTGVTVALVVVVRTVGSRMGLSSDLTWGLTFAAMIVGLRIGFDLTYAVLRAGERSGAAVALSTARHWTPLVASLIFVAVWRVSIAPFFAGQLAGELLVFLACVVLLERGFSVRRTRLDLSAHREALRYGLPLVVFHVAAVVLLYADRYLILLFFDANAVGQYAAGYNLAMMVQQSVAVPVSLAIVPLYMNLWSKGERAVAHEFIQSTLRWFWLGVWPCVFGVVAVQSDLVLLLATEKYLESRFIIGYILLGYVVHGGYPIFAAGLLLHQKTATLSKWMVVALGVNLVGNVILIPQFHILGAAVATMVSYLVLAAGIARAGRRYLTLRFWPREATIYLAAAFAMFLAVGRISLEPPLASLVVRVAAGVAIYGAAVLAADRDLRARLRAKVKR